MKSVSRILLIALMLIPGGVNAGPVATTAGSNLTAYHPNGGSANNNNWNSMTSPRNNGANTSAPVADFGNCNALIMRCAQPKCGSGCTDGNIAYGIVAGCVNSNETCKKHGDDLINYIVSQLVATSTVKAQQQQAAIAQQQNNEQITAMQNQVAQTQQMLAAQTSAMNDLREQLSQQQQASAQAIADAATAAASVATANMQQQSSYSVNNNAPVLNNNVNTDTGELSATQRAAAEAGVDEELLLRETISGQILSQIENAEQSLDTLAATMKDIFQYAGCDDRGSNCKGPKRVTRFKEKAREFFVPYEDAVDQLYDALELAQSVGVDISNIYQYLNNSCNQWGKYMCSKPLYTVQNPDTSDEKKKYLYQWPRYNKYNCENGFSKRGGPICGGNGTVNRDGECDSGALVASTKGNHECIIGQTIPPEDDSSCTMVGLIYQKNGSVDEIERHFLYPEDDDMGDTIRVGCASSMLQSARIFSRKKQKNNIIDIDILQRIVSQDASATNSYSDSYVKRSGKGLGAEERLKWCAISEKGYTNLQRYVAMKGLPSRNICINERKLNNTLNDTYIASSDSVLALAKETCDKNQNSVWSEMVTRCYCYDETGNGTCDAEKSKEQAEKAERFLCENQYYGRYSNNKCDCTDIEDDYDKELCVTKFSNVGTFQQNSVTTTSTTSADTASTDTTSEYDGISRCQKSGGKWDFSKKQCMCGFQTMLPVLQTCTSGTILQDNKIQLNDFFSMGKNS